MKNNKNWLIKINYFILLYFKYIKIRYVCFIVIWFVYILYIGSR